MNDNSDYVVRFGKIAWTINYEDKTGAFTFTFECDVVEYNITGKANKLFVSRTPIKNGKVLVCYTREEASHLELMIERVKGYLTSCGYKVEIE